METHPQMAPNVSGWRPTMATEQGTLQDALKKVYIPVKDDEWNVYLRYTEFRGLHHKLQNKFPQVRAYNFLPKKAIGNKSALSQNGSLENAPAPKEVNENQEAQGAAGPVSTLWTDWEIRLFLYEWEVVEREVRHPGKFDEKSEVIAQRLLLRGMRKDREQCLYLLESMKDLYCILCNERLRSEPLFSPYREALYRILGYPNARGCFPVPLQYQQFPVYVPPPVYAMVQDHLAPQWQSWHMRPPWEVPCMLPVVIPGVPNPAALVNL